MPEIRFHFALVRILSAQIINSYGDMDLTFAHLLGAPLLTTGPFGLDGRDAERMMREADVPTLEALPGTCIWVCLASADGEPIGCRGWDFHKAFATDDTLESVSALPVKQQSMEEVIRHLNTYHQNRNKPLH